MFSFSNNASVKAFHHLLSTLSCKHSSSFSTHASLLSLISNAKSLPQTKQSHASALLNAFLPQSISLCASLILKYATFHDPTTSLYLFHQTLPFSRSAFLWNTLIRALSVARVNDDFRTYNQMVKMGVRLDDHTFPFVLKACADNLSVQKGREIHGAVFKLGFDSDVFVGNTLLLFYGNCGGLKDVKRVFDEMLERDVVSWNSVIGVFSVHGFYAEAIHLFCEMNLRPGFRPNMVSVVSVLPVCAGLEDGVMGRQIHCYAVKTGLDSQVTVGNALVDVYGKCGLAYLERNQDALEMFRLMIDGGVKPNSVTFSRSSVDLFVSNALTDMYAKCDEVSYNILIIGYSQTTDCSESLSLFLEMGIKGIKLDVVSYMGVISACANLAALKQGKEVHGLAVRKHLHTHLFIANALLDFYIKCGRIDLAGKVFRQIASRDTASWNSMILGYGMLGELTIAINLFEAMKENGVEYDSVSYIAVLSACSHGGLVEEGKKYFEHMQVQNIKPTQMHYACMVDLLGRAGLIEEAVKLIESLPIEPDTNVWGALLGACRIHGNIELAHWAAEHLFKLKPQHSGYYSVLSNMYAEAGKWDEANQSARSSSGLALSIWMCCKRGSGIDGYLKSFLGIGLQPSNLYPLGGLLVDI
ncbi:hypothetical protein D5086_018034 [Populus alba]|uniref:Uncharacterized protein n=1 Tax=Populus alba TaxID=43335 RepID=A0ACC4BNQ1_POPAL